MEITIGLIATVCSIMFGYMGYQKGLKDENKKLGNNEGILNTDIQYIKRRTDEVLLEQKDTNRNIGFLTERVTRAEEGIKAVSSRVDNVVEDLKECKRTKVLKP